MDDSFCVLYFNQNLSLRCHHLSYVVRVCILITFNISRYSINKAVFYKMEKYYIIKQIGQLQPCSPAAHISPYTNLLCSHHYNPA